MKHALIAALALLAGCSSTAVKPTTETVFVDRPVREPCIEAAPVKPVYHAGEDQGLSGKEKARVLILDFEAAEQYGAEWEAAAAGCIKNKRAN